METNRKSVLLLQLKFLRAEEWTDADFTLLRSIAYSCPETGGDAVIVARGMLPAPERYEFPKEVEIYCGSGPRSVEEIAKLILSGTTVMPNPADDLVTVGFSKPFTGLMELRNTNGALLFSKKVYNTITEALPVAELPSGLYILSLKIDSGIQHSVKVSIQH